MSIAHQNCNSASRYCVSGCCHSGGGCATFNSTCIYRYSDFQSNPRYYFSQFSHPNCDPASTHCASGCCDDWGQCAQTLPHCLYRYSEFQTNSEKYYLAGFDRVKGNSDGAVIAGGVVAGVVLLVGIVVAVRWYRRKAVEREQQRESYQIDRDSSSIVATQPSHSTSSIQLPSLQPSLPHRQPPPHASAPANPTYFHQYNPYAPNPILPQTS